MKKKLNKKTLCLTAAALTLTAGLSVGSAMAYFTTYVTAQGGQELSLDLLRLFRMKRSVIGRSISKLKIPVITNVM